MALRAAIISDRCVGTVRRYTIRIEGADREWCVTKRYSDFVALDHALANELPDSLFSRKPLPPKGLLPRRGFIADRRERLERYLSHVLDEVNQKSDVAAVNGLADFLQCEDEAGAEDQDQHCYHTWASKMKSVYEGKSQFESQQSCGSEVSTSCGSEVSTCTSSSLLLSHCQASSSLSSSSSRGTKGYPKLKDKAAEGALARRCDAPSTLAAVTLLAGNATLILLLL